MKGTVRSSLRTRLTLVFVVLAIGPLLVVGGLSGWQNYQLLLERQLVVEHQTAKAVAQEVAGYFHGLEHEMRSIVAVRGIDRLSTLERQELLEEMLAYEGAFDSLGLFDGTGREMVRVSRLDIVTALDLAEGAAQRPEVAMPLARGTTYFGPVRFASDTGEPRMTIGLPIAAPRSGRVETVLVAELRIKRLWDLIARQARSKGHQVYIVDDSDNVVAHRNPSVVLRGTHFAPVDEDGLAPGLDGDTVVAASQIVTLGDQHFHVVSERTLAAAFELATRLLATIGAVALVALFVSLGVGVLAVRRIVAPVRALADAARDIAAGDTGRTAEVKGATGEISELADAFNTMTVRLQETLAQVRASEGRLQSIIDYSPAAIFVKDLDGRMLLANQGTARALGRPLDEILGRLDSELLPPEVVGPLRANDRMVAVRATAVEAEETVLGANGSTWTFLSGKFPLRDAEGRVFAVCGISTDITERKEAEATLQRTIDELMRSNSELERFAYIASHDLQEPLRSIISFSQLLERRCAAVLPPEGMDFLTYIVAAARRMNEMVADLLDFSRVGQKANLFQPVDLSQVLADTLADMADLIAGSGTTIQAALLPTVPGDAPQLASLLQNLLSNAIKFRKPGLPCRITITASQDGDDCTVNVADNGIGIEPQYLDQIFVIFKRLHTVAAIPGTGIGLAVCQRVVERHGGRIRVRSVPGEGSVFSFTLPLTDPSVRA